MESLLQDLRYGLRGLARHPGFTLSAVLTLALGIGANTAIFSVVYAVILRPLPYPHPERIVQLAESYQGQIDERDVTTREFEFLREHMAAFQSVAVFTPVGFNLSGSGEPERVNGLHVSSNYFQVLGVSPRLGKDFPASADRDAGDRSAILSDGLWRSRFGGDPGLVGKSIQLDGETYTVAGILPPGFRAIPPPGFMIFQQFTGVEVWTALGPVARTTGSGQNLALLGRLAPGVTPAQVRAQMGIVTEDFARAFPDDSRPGVHLELLQYQRMISEDARPILMILFGAVGFVLLIACANVANLLLGRAAARSKEIAVRMALGASRARLQRQLLTESVLLALAGGLAGLLVARAGLSTLVAMSPTNLPRASEIQIDGWAFGFAFFIALLTGILFGLAPALQASRTDVNETLKKGTASSGPRRGRLRSMLAVSEIGLSLLLLTGAGLLMGSYWNLLRADAGFEPSHILTMQVWLTGSRYNSTSEVAAFYNQVLQRVERLPGVQSAGVVSAGLPLERGGNMPVTIPGKETPDAFGFHVITPDYFRAVGVPLKLGRAFTAADTEGSSGVAIVNESFARKIFPGKNPLGEHLVVGRAAPAAPAQWREIVGVAGDVKSYLDQPAQPSVFLPLPQSKYGLTKLFEQWFATNIVVRTAGDPLLVSAAAERELHAVDPALLVGKIRSMEQVRSTAVAFRQFNMVLLSVFAGLAMVLAAVGIYGVMAHAVAQRTREIGVRVAVGAQQGDILRLVVGEGMLLAGVGISIGAIGALLLGRLLESQLYGVKPGDPVTFATVALLQGAVALLACYIPARRATKVDPLEALRYE